MSIIGNDGVLVGGRSRREVLGQPYDGALGRLNRRDRVLPPPAPIQQRGAGAEHAELCRGGNALFSIAVGLQSHVLVRI